MPPPGAPIAGTPPRPGVVRPVGGITVGCRVFVAVGCRVLRVTSFNPGNKASRVGSGTQRSPTRFCPLGQTRVSCFSPFVGFGTDAGRLAFLVSEGRGE